MYRPAVNSMLLASTRPDRLGDWYAAAFEPGSATTMNGYRILRFGTFHLLVDRRGDIGDTTPEPGRVIVNIDVDDARAVVARMDAMGVEWLAELEDRDGSLFATAIDPAGSYVQLVQLHPGHGPRAEDGDGALLGSAAFSGFAVDDLDAAETFYRDTLGVPVRRHDGLLDLQLPGDRDVLVHPRPDHAPAAFTILNFPVPDIDRAVDELGARGVELVRHPGLDHDERGIVRGGLGLQIAWFTDPAGNVLSVLEVP